MPSGSYVDRLIASMKRDNTFGNTINPNLELYQKAERALYDSFRNRSPLQKATMLNNNFSLAKNYYSTKSRVPTYDLAKYENDAYETNRQFRDKNEGMFDKLTRQSYWIDLARNRGNSDNSIVASR